MVTLVSSSLERKANSINFYFCYGSNLDHRREFKQPRRLRQIKRHLRVNICAMVAIFGYCFLLAFYIVDRLRYTCTGRRAVELNIEIEKFTVVCPRCR